MYNHGIGWTAGLLVLGFVIVGISAPVPAEDARETLLSNPLLDFEYLLVVKRGEKQLGLSQNWESNSTLPKNGYDNEIALLSLKTPEADLVTIFRPPKGAFVGDVDLDFDADRMLFSMPVPNGRWQVWEMERTKVGFRKPHQLPLIEEPDVDNYDACYLPSGDIIFCSTAPFIGVPCVTGSSHVCALYLFERDSGRIRALTFEQDHDWCPTVLNNGRVLYLRWEYSDIPHFVSRILFHMNPDGTSQMEYYGSNSYWPNAMFYARPIPNDPSKFVAIIGGHHDVPRMGELILFDTAKGRREADGVIQRIPGRGKKVEPIILDGLVGGSWPKFLHPYPLSDEYFLVSAKPTPESKWGIYLVDVFDNMTLIKEIEGYALFEPVPLRKTPRPPIVPNRVDTDRTDAVVYMADVYRGGGLDGVPRGTVKQLRLFTYHFAYHGMGGQINRIGLDGPWDIKRIMGTVPVEADGSALFRVPANTPISIQPLDEEGKALQLMRSWMTAMPGETLSCVGCHERQNTSPPVTQTLAGRRPPSEIAPWYGPTRGFSFEREVQPVLDIFCVGCHDGQAADRPDFAPRAPVHTGPQDNAYKTGSKFTPSYLALRRFIRSPTIESDMHMLPPAEFHADTATLLHMFEAGHHGVELDAEAWDRLITWMDLGTPFHGTWHENVGEEKVNHLRDRRREMMKRYAGLDEDPEAIPPTEVLERTYIVPPPDPPDDPPLECAGWPFDTQEAARQQGDPDQSRRSINLGNGLTLELVLIPAGEFVMGEPGGVANQRPQTRMTIGRPFWLGRYEISNEQYGRFDPQHDSRLEHGDFLQFSIEERGYPVNAPSQPVCRVSWDDATAFCVWLSEKTGESFTLPTEADWEYACRAGTASPLWYGDADADFASWANLADTSLRHVDTFAPWSLPSGAIPLWRPAAENVNDGFRVSAPVGSFPKANPWGLYDMHGNVAEWTATAYQPYPYDSTDGRDDLSAPGKKVVRGGSWYDHPKRAGSGYRIAYAPWQRVFNVGFRVVSDAP